MNLVGKLSLILLTGIFLLSGPGVLLADSQVTKNNSPQEASLQISDCKGDIRFAQQVSEADAVQVIAAIKPGGSVQARLSNNDKEITAVDTKTEGALVFNNVPAGQWKLCNEKGEYIAFNDIQVKNLMDDKGYQAASSNKALIGGSVAAAGIAASAIALSGSSGGDNSLGGEGRGGDGEVEVAAPSSVAPPAVDAQTDNPPFDDNDFTFGSAGAGISPSS